MKIIATGNKFRNFVGLAMIAAFGATTTTALAADTGTLTVNAVEYANTQLLIQLSTGNNYIAVPSAPSGCTSATADSKKIWASQAQSALLSGKRLKIYYTICSSVPYIDAVDIWN